MSKDELIADWQPKEDIVAALESGRKEREEGLLQEMEGALTAWGETLQVMDDAPYPVAKKEVTEAMKFNRLRQLGQLGIGRTKTAEEHYKLFRTGRSGRLKAIQAAGHNGNEAMKATATYHDDKVAQAGALYIKQ
jgi:hypothetical protein